MSSWFHTSSDEYEPLHPLPPPPRRGRSQMLKYAVISGIACVGVTAILVFVILNGTATSSNTSTGEVPLLKATPRKPVKKVFHSAEEDEVQVLRSEETEEILVDLDQGTLRGMKLKSRGGRDYLAFIGIPYAKPPLGELRFQPPVEADPWEGTLDASKLTPQCIQKDKYAPTLVQKGAEDCLYLNVYTSKPLQDLRSRRNRFPVMLYIHGGGPFGNGSRYRPDYFMDEDVVFITVHYRLGVLGNLNTNDSAARGNQGMKDQVMALQWIRDNIKKFGGNRRKVTLFGNSYGGMQVHAHALSRASKGLFHRMICQSGVLMSPGMLNENPAKTAFELGARLNCTDSSSMELVECLRRLPAETLVLNSFDDPFVFSIEPPSEDDEDDTIISAHPLKLLQNGDMNNIPAIFGVNSGEALFGTLDYLILPNGTDEVNNNWNETVSKALKLDITAEDPYAIANAAREFYFGDKDVSRETQANWTNLFSDRETIHPNSVAATFQSERNGRRNKVFLYYFNREVARKYTRNVEAEYKPTEFLGASHADELQLLFPYDDYPYVPLDSEYATLSKTMVKLWVSFAADGVPTGATNEWLQIRANEKPYKYFQLDDFPKMVDPVGDRMGFWDRFNLTDLYESKDPLNPSPLLY